jgi:hypothetical protein
MLSNCATILSQNCTKVVTSSYNLFNRCTMNLKILLFIFFAAILASCSTMYRSGQTPDDVYYSPARPIEEKHEEKEEVRVVRRGPVDRQIVMSIHDPRWRSFDDDYDSYYDPYRYGYTCGYYYNPYYYPSPVYFSGTTFTNPKNSTPRKINLGSYNNYSNMVVVNPKAGYTSQVKSFRYNNNNADNIRRIIIPTTPTYNNSAPRSYDNSSNSSRTYSPSTNSSYSSGSSSSGSSGAPVSRPRR